MSPVPIKSGPLPLHLSSQGRKAVHSTIPKKKLDEENELIMGNEIIDQTVTQKQLPKAYGLPIFENIATSVANEYLFDLNYRKFYVHTLNKETIKNKNIHLYCKRNDKPWLDIQNVVLKAKAAVVDIANLCLEADKKNVVIHLRDVVIKATDAITLAGNVNHQITFETKERLKNALSQDYKTICEQDNFWSKQLLGEGLADNVKIKTKVMYSVNHSVNKSEAKSIFYFSKVSNIPFLKQLNG